MNKGEKRRHPCEGFLDSLKNFRIGSFIIILTVLGFLSIALPKPTVSEVEKRNLAKMPSFSVQALLSGNYTRDISAFYSDTFPFRDQFVAVANRFKECFGFSYDGIRLQPGETLPLLPSPPPIEEKPPLPPLQEQHSSVSENSPSSATQAPSSQPPVASQPPTTDTEQSVTDNGIFIYQNKAYQLYYGGPKTGYSYAQAIANISAQLPNVQVYNLVIPSPIEFALPPKYRSVSAEEKPQIDTMYQNIAVLSEGRVRTVNAYDNIKAHSDEYLYFGTDHHWTSLGAYYAYQAFCEVAGTTPISLEGLEKRTKENFLGTLYSRTRNSTLAANPDHVDYYMMPTQCKVSHYTYGGNGYSIEGSLYAEGVKGSNSYTVFISGDMPLTVIDTEAQNGRTIAVVKESYGNAFVPYLVNNFQRVVVVDPRHCLRNFGDILTEFGVNELLFINNIFAAHTPGNKDMIWRLSREIESYQNGSWQMPATPPAEEPPVEVPAETPEQPEEIPTEDHQPMEEPDDV